ncbi:MAG: SDR family NAD(P)-dependent oxidoreductase [Bryobacteraceae bacterium]|jgi:NAD(P)-dependent dehydrogenase (short-subunit alcohol dehydrogenase family)
MSIRFDDRTVVITGAGNGLGRSYALCLAGLGANVVVNDLGVAPNGTGASEEPARRVVDEIAAGGGKAVASFDDVSRPEGAASLIRQSIEHFGAVDVVVCNAGVLRDRRLTRMPLEDFEFVLRVHLLGSAYVVKAALPRMTERGYGRIVLTTSTSGLYGCHGQTNYSSAKLAIVGLMKSLRLESPANICVNTIAPLAATRQTQWIFANGLRQSFDPRAVAAMVAYLASEECLTSGDVIVAGAGHYAKAEVVQSPGCRFELDAITPEQIAASYGRITDMQGAVPYASGKAALTEIAGAKTLVAGSGL